MLLNSMLFDLIDLNPDMKDIKMPHNCFAVWWVKCGVLPNCEAVGLVSTLGNQVVLWEERNIKKKTRKMFFAETYY